jgi:hypothetical protein
MLAGHNIPTADDCQRVSIVRRVSLRRVDRVAPPANDVVVGVLRAPRRMRPLTSGALALR